MKLNKKEIQILSIFIAIWGIFLIGNGIVLSSSDEKTETKVKYSLNVSKKQISQAQFKKNEIILKDFEIEVNSPISVNVKDYLVDADQLNETMLEQLELDTSSVNINQAGSYNYYVKYNKKKYQGRIIIKEKELPDMTFTLKNISLETGKAIPTDIKLYVNETIPEELLKTDALELDLRQVNNQVQNDYKYYIIYKNTKYEGIISVRDKGPVVHLPEGSGATTPTITCPTDAELKDNTCICKDSSKQYDQISKTCIDKNISIGKLQ